MWYVNYQFHLVVFLGKHLLLYSVAYYFVWAMGLAYACYYVIKGGIYCQISELPVISTSLLNRWSLIQHKHPLQQILCGWQNYKLLGIEICISITIHQWGHMISMQASWLLVVVCQLQGRNVVRMLWANQLATLTWGGAWPCCDV